ncbi:MAG: ABC transporter permease [Vampirovibrionales bacterium]|nr:ABC transporter permease [Vampirovibrionales bacterium]
MHLPVELYIALRYTLANLRQSLLIAFAVGLGVAIIIFIPSVNLSFFNYFLEKTVENSSHIKITREIDTMARNRDVLSARLAKPEQDVLFSDRTLTRKRDIQAYRALSRELLALPGVVEVAPFVNEQVIIVHGGQSQGASIQGIVPEQEMRIRRLQDEIAVGSLETMGPGDVFLGWRLADELGVRMGGRVQLVTAKTRKSFKLAGLVNSGVYSADMGSVLLSLKGAQQLLGMGDSVTGLSLKIKDIYDAKKLSDLIAQTYHVKSRNWMEDNEIILSQIGMFRVIIAFISFLIVFAAASSITSVLIMVVSSKSREIGILKAMGLQGPAIMRLFVFQAVCLSLLGAAAGVLGGQGLISLYNATPYSRAETFLGIARQPVAMNAEYTGYALFYALLSSVLASLIPAWNASRLDPVKAINQ